MLFGTCDEYSISSSIASAGVLKVFLNDEKIKNLVIHVRSDLAPFLIDQVLRKPEKNDADSELEVIRTSSQALRTLSKFYQKTADKDEEGNQPKIMNMDAMMDSKIFWKLGRSKEAQVRAGFFEFGLAYLRNTNSIPDKNLENWTKSILSSLGEEDPLCLKPLWAAVLLILKKSQTDSKIFEHVNFLKAFVPGLWSVLRGGAFGCGSIIYPHTLPLLANVPKELAVDPFYPNFFNNFADGIRDIESKTEVKHGLLGLFECYQYAAKNEMIPDVCERVSSIISSSIRNESTIKIPDLAQPLYKLLSTFKKNQEQKYDEILTSLHNVINEITSEMRQNPTRESFQLLENCCKLVEILYRTETMAQRKAGVHFTTEGANEAEASPETLLTEDLLDLVILLVAPFDQSDPLISAVQLMVISFLTKSKNSKWMTKVFSKIHQKLYSGSPDQNESDRNALLMEKFIIPKLENAFQADLDSSIAALTSKTRNVMISLKYDSDDENHVTPKREEQHVTKSDGSKEILSSVTDMIFYLASGNASSCTKLLKISSDPEKIVPLLPFICRKINENNDDESNKTLQEYYSQCSLLNQSHIVAILLQNGPRSLVEDICGDISVQFEEARDLSTLIKLVKLRFSMARDVAEHIPVGLNKLGASWARLVFNDGHPNDSGTDATQNIIDIVSSFFPIAIFANFIQSVLDLFTQHDFSTVTFAKTIEYFTMIKQTCLENDEDSKNNQFVPMIHNLFEHKLNSFGENCEKSRIGFLRQLIGVDAADQSIISSSNDNFFNQYLLKLIVFNLLTIDEMSPNMIESISKSKSQLLPFSGYVVSEKRGWQSVELGPSRLSETFGFLVFEFSKIEIECSRTDGDDFHILISEILTETEIPIHSKYFKITESDDESLLIGALEQLRIIGVGDFMPDSSRDYLAARANFCKLFQSCIVHASGELNSDQWDFILCNTVEWLNDIAETIDEKITADQLLLMNATLRLLKSVGQFLNSPSARTDPSLPTDLLTTWTEFFMPEIAKNVFTLIIKFKEDDELLENLTWMNIYDVTAFIGLDSLLKMEVPLSLSLDLKCPDNVNSLFNHFYKNLKSSSQINATISAGFIKVS